MLSQHGLKAKFFGFGLGLIVSGLGLVLGLVQRWICLQVVVSIAIVVNKLSDIAYGNAMALTLSFDTSMTTIAIFLELNSN